MQHFKKYQKPLLVFIGLCIAGIYSVFNPYEVDFFPQCPVHHLTGFLCPGCGAQRCLHFLLTGQITAAFEENLLLPLSLPYLGFHTYLHTKKEWREREFKLREFLFGKKAIWVILTVVLLFTVIRNTFAI